MTARGERPDETPLSQGSSTPRFTPTPEAVEAVANALQETRFRSDVHPAQVAIVAFVEAEGLTMRVAENEPPMPEAAGWQRLVGPWRKRGYDLTDDEAAQVVRESQ